MGPIAQSIPWSVFFLLMLFCPQETLNGSYGTVQLTILARRVQTSLDEATEHSNNFIKQGIRNLGPNVTEKAVSRLSYSEMHTVKIHGNLDEIIKCMLRSGKHSEGSTKRDLHELVNRAAELNIFTEIQGRNYNHLKKLSMWQTRKLKCLKFVPVDQQRQKEYHLGHQSSKNSYINFANQNTNDTLRCNVKPQLSGLARTGANSPDTILPWISAHAQISALPHLPRSQTSTPHPFPSLSLKVGI